MTDMTADDELGVFRSDYRRLLELTDTTGVPSGLQPQFLARMLKRPPADVVELHTIYERAADPAPGDDAGLGDDVRRHLPELRELLSAAEQLGEQAAPVRPLGRGDPVEECDRFGADHSRLLAMCAAVEPADPDSVLFEVGARRADLVALQVLVDRVDDGVDPVEVVEDVLDRRPLLDELTVRVADLLPEDSAFLPEGDVVGPRATTGRHLGPTGSADDEAHVAHLESLAFQDSYDWLLELTDCSGLDRTSELQELSRRLAVPLDRVIGVRALYDDVRDPDADPLDHVDHLREARDLLDDLLTRAEDRTPDDGQLAPVVELDSVRARHGRAPEPEPPSEPAADHPATELARRIEARTAGREAPLPIGVDPGAGSPIIAHSAGAHADGRSDDDECDGYLAAFDELGRQTGTIELEPEVQAVALHDLLGVPVGDAEGLRDLADRIVTRFAPRRVLAAEARARRPQLDRLAAAAVFVTPLPPAAPTPAPPEPDVDDAGPEAIAPLPGSRPPGEEDEPAAGGPGPVAATGLAARMAGSGAESDDDPSTAPDDRPVVEERDLEEIEVGGEEADVGGPIDPRMEEFRRMRAVRDQLGAGGTPTRDETAPEDTLDDARPGETVADESRRGPVGRRIAAMSPPRRLVVAVVAVIVVVDLIVIGWWLVGRSDSGGDEPAGGSTQAALDDDEAVGAVTGLAPAPGSDADVVASVSGDACHLVAIGAFPTLSGARDFTVDPATPGELADRSRVLASTTLSGFGPDGYVVVALGENPGDAQRLADIAADAGVETAAPVSLDRRCPDAAS